LAGALGLDRLHGCPARFVSAVERATQKCAPVTAWQPSRLDRVPEWRTLMNISDRKKGNILIMQVSGQIKFGTSSERFAKHFDDLMESGERQFVFDMVDVPWMDTAGINATVACMKHLKDRDGNGEIKLALRGKNLELFVFYSLNKVFDIHEDVESALAAFAGQS